MLGSGGEGEGRGKEAMWDTLQQMLDRMQNAETDQMVSFRIRVMVGREEGGEKAAQDTLQQIICI